MLVLGDVSNVERLHSVFNILTIQIVNLTDIMVPEEKHNNKRAKEHSVPSSPGVTP